MTAVGIDLDLGGILEAAGSLATQWGDMLTADALKQMVEAPREAYDDVREHMKRPADDLKDIVTGGIAVGKDAAGLVSDVVDTLDKISNYYEKLRKKRADRNWDLAETCWYSILKPDGEQVLKMMATFALQLVRRKDRVQNWKSTDVAALTEKKEWLSCKHLKFPEKQNENHRVCIRDVILGIKKEPSAHLSNLKLLDFEEVAEFLVKGRVKNWVWPFSAKHSMGFVQGPFPLFVKYSKFVTHAMESPDARNDLSLRLVAEAMQILSVVQRQIFEVLTCIVPKLNEVDGTSELVSSMWKASLNLPADELKFFGPDIRVPMAIVPGTVVGPCVEMDMIRASCNRAMSVILGISPAMSAFFSVKKGKFDGRGLEKSMAVLTPRLYETIGVIQKVVVWWFGTISRPDGQKYKRNVFLRSPVGDTIPKEQKKNIGKVLRKMLKLEKVLSELTFVNVCPCSLKAEKPSCSVTADLPSRLAVCLENLTTALTAGAAATTKPPATPTVEAAVKEEQMAVEGAPAAGEADAPKPEDSTPDPSAQPAPEVTPEKDAQAPVVQKDVDSVKREIVLLEKIDPLCRAVIMLVFGKLTASFRVNPAFFAK